MSEEIELKLHVEEVNSLLAVLGDLPTRTNAWPLAQKILSQLKDKNDVDKQDID
jgi:hypothetical protein